MNTQRLELINTLHTSGIINDTERDRAERYLDLSSHPFTTLQEALDWAIKNRIINKDHQNEAQKQLLSAQQTVIEISATPAPSQADVTPKLSLPCEQTHFPSKACSDILISVTQDDIFAANSALLNQLTLKKAQKEEIRQQLKRYYGYFVNADYLKDWYKNGFKKQDLSPDFLLTLFQLLSEDEISHSDYLHFAIFENITGDVPVFNDKYELISWLFDNIFPLPRPADFQHAHNDNRLERLNNQLYQKGKININTYEAFKNQIKALAIEQSMLDASEFSNQTNVFHLQTEQELLSWIEQNEIKRPVWEPNIAIPDNIAIDVTQNDIYNHNLAFIEQLSANEALNTQQEQDARENLKTLYYSFTDIDEADVWIDNNYQFEWRYPLSDRFLLALYQLLQDQAIDKSTYQRVIFTINNMDQAPQIPRFKNKVEAFYWVYNVFGFSHSLLSYAQAQHCNKMHTFLNSLFNSNDIDLMTFLNTSAFIHENTARYMDEPKELLIVSNPQELLEWIHHGTTENARENDMRALIHRERIYTVFALIIIITLLICLYALMDYQ